MIYGMLLATDLLEEYSTLGWIWHPDISSALVMASLQREVGSPSGKVSVAENKQGTKIKKAIDALLEDWKKLKQNNSSLNM